MSLRIILIFWIFSCLALEASKQNIACDILIVGGGPSGIHTAYQLSKTQSSNICLIEKENHLGGRLYDVALDPQRPDLLYGLGALRVMESQSYLLRAQIKIT